jgi:hypothetical protein
MATGKTHAMASSVLAIASGAAVAWATRDWFLGLSAAVGCLAGVMITPDLD